MPATAKQKVQAIESLAVRCWSAGGELIEWARRLLRYLEDPVLQITPEQRQRFLASYDALRTAIQTAAADLPANLATWEPPPESIPEAPP